MRMHIFVSGLRAVMAGLLLVSAGAALAQPPLPPGPGESRDRRPNDQIEGGIWQYTATRKDAEEPLEGRIRIDKLAIFQVEKEFRLPEKGKLPGGPGGSLKLPAPPEAKRIGDITKNSDGRIRLTFLSGDLKGQALLTSKKDQPGVWRGEYRQKIKDGDKEKLGPIWTMELRESED